MTLRKQLALYQYPLLANIRAKTKQIQGTGDTGVHPVPSEAKTRQESV